MKTWTLIAFIALLLFQGCGIHNARVFQSTATNVEIQLSKKNFRVVDKVKGSSRATYIFGIGGLSNKALIEKARANMMENVKLEGTSRTIINQTYETHHSIIYPFFYRKTITVSGYVIEFTE